MNFAAKPLDFTRTITISRPSEESIVTPTRELVSLSCLVMIYLAASAIGGDIALWLRTIAGPVILTTILLAGATQMILKDVAALWTALFWFRLSSAIYFGIGNLAPFVLADEFVVYMQTFFDFADENVAKLNLLYALSAIAVLLASKVFLVLLPPKQGVTRPSAPTRAMLAVGLLFLAIGALVKYFLVAPTMFNLLDFVVPGSIGLLGNFTVPALFFITAYAVEHDRKYFPLAVALLLIEGGIGLLGMTKQGLLTPLIVFLIALIRARITVPRLAAVSAVFVFIFITIIPVVIDGRLELESRHGSAIRASLGERVEVLYRSSAGELRTTASDVSATGIALVRLSYVNQAGFAMYLYDSGQPGATLGNAYAAFIPRFLWKEKPIMTSTGSDFNMMARGSAVSSSSPTLAGEAYWNFGWTGVLLIMVPMGMLFALMSRYALHALHDGRWILFPAIILGVGIGHRVDGHIVADLIGMPVIMLGAHMVLASLERGIAMLIPAERSVDPGFAEFTHPAGLVHRHRG